jgi:hypothetical protein
MTFLNQWVPPDFDEPFFRPIQRRNAIIRGELQERKWACFFCDAACVALLQRRRAVRQSIFIGASDGAPCKGRNRADWQVPEQ